MTHPFSRQVVATINGPGEVSGWLLPFAAALKKAAPDTRLCAALMPCVFATNAEYDVIRSMPEVDAVCRPGETLGCIVRGRKPEGFEPLPGWLLHFGGEPALSLLMARRMGYRALAYGEHPVSLPWRFEKIYLVDPPPPGTRCGDRYEPLGNLMIDAARMRCPRRERAGNGPPAIGLFPGSRPSAYEHTLPFLIKVADEAARSLPGARWLIARSPYVIQEALVRAGAGAQWREGALVSERGTRLEICPPERVMSLADIAITPPGTSTAEMAALGLRMIVWFGTGHIAMHPLHGMAGHLERIPLFGPRLKRAAARRQYRRMQFHAHPNRAAGRCIVPEMVGDVTASAMVRALLEELEKPAEPIERELMAAMGPPGAAMRLVERVLRFPPERRTLAGN